MSFGFGVGDFLDVIKLVKEVRKNFVGAPDQFKAVSGEVRRLSIVLQDTEVYHELGLNDEQAVHLRDISNGCQEVLQKLQKTLGKYREVDSNATTLRTRARRAWKKLTLEPSDISELRVRIIFNVGLLSAFLGNINSGTTYEIRKTVDQLNQRQEDEHRQTILNWLTPLNYYYTQQLDCINRRQPGTGQLELPSYKTWTEEPGKILFCHGIPGAGKTILTSIVVEDLMKRSLADSSMGVAFFYCNYSMQNEQTVDHFMASLLKQLAASQSSLSTSVIELFDGHRNRQTTPSCDELSRALIHVMGTYTRVFLAVDALDECQVSDRRRATLLSKLLSLQVDCKLSIFATSRSVPDVIEAFSQVEHQEIRASEEDVRSFLGHNLSQLPIFVRDDPSLQEEIITKVSNAVNGMFLLAQLHLGSLQGKRSRKAIRNALENLSSGADAYEKAYDDTMSRIKSQLLDEQELALQTLLWISCARRPLDTAELQHALAIESGTTQFDQDNVSPIELLLSVCAGLVTVDNESGIVSLVHYTTQEYLGRTKDRWFPDADHQLAAACITYLCFDVFDTGACSTWKTYVERVETYCLYRYAACNLEHHAHTTSASEMDCLLGSEERLAAARQGKLLSNRHYARNWRFQELKAKYKFR